LDVVLSFIRDDEARLTLNLVNRTTLFG
jgi:hypothetical protein